MKALLVNGGAVWPENQAEHVNKPFCHQHQELVQVDTRTHKTSQLEGAAPDGWLWETSSLLPSSSLCGSSPGRHLVRSFPPQHCKYIRGTLAIWVCSRGASDWGVVGLTPIIPMCGWPCWRRSTSSLWSRGVCPCLFFFFFRSIYRSSWSWWMWVPVVTQETFETFLSFFNSILYKFLPSVSLLRTSASSDQIYFWNVVWHARNLYHFSLQIF